MALGRRNAAILDELLTSLFEGLRSGAIVVGSSRPVPPGAWDDVALAGVGSYGRGAVALKSDLDVRLLARNVDKAAAVADALLYPLWDMGVSIGHQVVTVDDLLHSAKTDLPAATSLLDWRHVAGDRSLSEALRKRGVFVDSRGDRLRLGPAPYLRDDELDRGTDLVIGALQEA